MPSIHDDAWDNLLDAARLESYLTKDPSIINSPGGKNKITPLAAACWRGHLEVVKVLLAEDADPNARSSHNRTPLYFVTTQTDRSKRFDILQVLLESEVDINMVCDEEGNTPLMNAVSQSRDRRVVRELVDRGASQTIENHKKQTAATLAKSGMDKYLRPKAERNSTRAHVVDLAVSAVLLVISYTNSGFINSVVRGVTKKLYKISGSEAPEVAKELPKPATIEEFKADLSNYVRNSKLKRFFAKNDPFLEKLAARAIALREDNTTDLGKPDNIKELARFSLYRTVIYCDDSGSMGLNDRFENQQELVSRIARIATRIVPDDYPGVDLRFIHAEGSDRLDAKAIKQAMDRVQPEGRTPIGTSLLSKVLDPLVYNEISTGNFNRPIFVCIITDGSPTDEPPDAFTDAIVDCQTKLGAAGYDPTSVMFLVSQIGSDESATDFLQSLRATPGLETVLHCTSDRLDDKFRELKEEERMLELWLFHMLTKAIVED